MGQQIRRVVRVLVYEGDPAWVQRTLERGAVQPNGSRVLPFGSLRSSIVDDVLTEVVLPSPMIDAAPEPDAHAFMADIAREQD